MNRRDVLIAPPAVALAALLPDTAAASVPDTHMMALYREWEDLRDVTRRRDIPDEVRQEASDDMLAVEDRMLVIPSTGLEDFVAKLLADTSGGDFGPCEAIIAEAKALIGARD